MAFQLFLYWASKSLTWDPERKAKGVNPMLQLNFKSLQSQATRTVQVFRVVCSQDTLSRTVLPQFPS